MSRRNPVPIHGSGGSQVEVGTIWLSVFFGRLLLAISVKRSELTEGHHQEWSPRLDLTLLGKSLPEPSLAARGRRLSFSRLGFLGCGSPRWFRWCVTVLVSSTTLTTTFQTIANAGESASRARSLLSVACPCRLASRVVGGRRGLLLALGGSSPPRFSSVREGLAFDSPSRWWF